MERAIMLSLEKAKEFYAKGGEFRDLALGAYTEEELAKAVLPKTWEEFCENYPIQKGECWLGTKDNIFYAAITQDRNYRNWIPSQKAAEAHLAMIQLEQLRNCYRQGWVPDYDDGAPKYYITIGRSGAIVRATYYESRFLTFQDSKTTFEFAERFSDLIKKAGDLI